MKYKVSLNGKIYEVEVEEGSAMLLAEYESSAPGCRETAAAAPALAPASPAAESAGVAGGFKVEAPLPGNVLSLKVAEGEKVREGDVLLVIEAMKMENEIAAPRDGTVRQIIKGEGAVVATGDLLMVI